MQKGLSMNHVGSVVIVERSSSMNWTYLMSLWGFGQVTTQMLGTFVTTLGFSMVISLLLLYIIASIALLQVRKTVAYTSFVHMVKSITTSSYLVEKMVRSQDILSFTSTMMIQASSTIFDDVVKRSAKKTRKSLRGLWQSFVTTHTHNILGVWARLTTLRTIMSH
jgi:hypothetical protein